MINAVINHWVKEKGQNAFICFVDFETAFDSVDRNLLFAEVEEAGIKGRMLKFIKAVYKRTVNEIMANEETKRRFKASQGVRQGCRLSPLLFNIFLDDIDKEFSKRNIGGITMGKIEVYLGKYAHDIAAIAPDQASLQLMLKVLEKFAAKIFLRVNTKKTQMLVIGGKGRNTSANWKYGDDQREEVKDFKYLSCWISCNNS